MNTSTKDQTLRALKIAAEKIGAHAYKAGLYKVKRNRKGVVIRGYTLTPEHQEVITAIDALSRDLISPEDAMCVLHGYEVLNSRTKGY
jgi:hypothetical protein